MSDDEPKEADDYDRMIASLQEAIRKNDERFAESLRRIKQIDGEIEIATKRAKRQPSPAAFVMIFLPLIFLLFVVTNYPRMQEEQANAEREANAVRSAKAVLDSLKLMAERGYTQVVLRNPKTGEELKPDLSTLSYFKDKGKP